MQSGVYPNQGIVPQQVIVAQTVPPNVVQGVPPNVAQRVPPNPTNGESPTCRKASRRLGATEICIGILAVLFQMINIIVATPISHSGTGIWAGIFIIMTGSFGVVSGKTKNRCPTITFLVLNIVSIFLVCIIVGVSCISLGILNSEKEWMRDCMQREGYEYYLYEDHYDYDDSSSDYDTATPRNWNHEKYDSEQYHECLTLQKVGTAAESFLIVLGLAEFVIAIIASGFSCGRLCCNTAPTQRVYYYSQPGIVTIQGGPGVGQVQQTFVVQSQVQGHPTQGPTIPYPGQVYIPQPPPYGEPTGQTQGQAAAPQVQLSTQEVKQSLPS